MLNFLTKLFPQKWEHVYPPFSPTWDYDPNLPKAVIVDIDGTLCDLNGRNPFDPSESDQDLPNQQLTTMLLILQGLRDTHSSKKVTPIFITMRSYEVYPLLENYLDQLGLDTNRIYMREPQDRRHSPVIKKEIYEKHIKGKYNILGVFEDDAEVIHMWRKECKLFCLQVNDSIKRKRKNAV